jgi:hypothetical protein
MGLISALHAYRVKSGPNGQRKEVWQDFFRTQVCTSRIAELAAGTFEEHDELAGHLERDTAGKILFRV